jgi:hypothetical protein
MVNTSEGAIFGVLDRIYKTMLKIDDNGQGRTDRVVSIERLGTPINPEDYKNPWTPFLESGEEGDDEPDSDDPSLKSASNVARLVDKKLGRTGNGDDTTRTTQKVSSTWEAIVNGAQLSSAQVTQYTQEEDEDFQDAFDVVSTTEKVPGPRDPKTREKTYVDEPCRTRTYQRYLDCKKAFEKAEEKYTDGYAESLDSKRAKQLWPTRGKRFISAISDARDDWASIGKREIVENALNVMKARGKNPTAGMIANAKQTFNVYQRALEGQIETVTPYSYITPSNWCDPEDDDIWTKYEGEFKTSDSHDSSKTTEWHAELSVDYGLFSGSASSAGGQTDITADASSQDTSISLRWAVVDIERPWLDTALLSFGGWYLKMPGAKKNCISNGAADFIGNLPCIPTQMILVKDVVVKNAAIQKHMDYMSKHLEVEASFSYGPFASGSAGYSSKEEKKNTLEKMAKEGLSIPGIQRIGWVSAITSSSPQLDNPNQG